MSLLIRGLALTTCLVVPCAVSCANGARPGLQVEQTAVADAGDPLVEGGSTAAPPLTFATDASVADADGGFVTCASVAVEAQREPLPVDIVWVVDNSSSMMPAVAEVQSGLNAFATLLGGRGLDYRMVLLSLRGTAPLTVGGSTRYPVCIPPPLGGADCGNAPHFVHARMDVLSTQPLEQILGTLDQTAGYANGAARGSEPWAQVLRANATKSIVLVTDDNSRFPAVSFEMFPGGPNPYTNGLTLPVGLLHPSRGDAWKGYVFSAIYGWGTTVDPSIRCAYSDGSRPTSSGPEYTTLVARTGGARAQLCEGSAAWSSFFDSVATAVIGNARVSCELALPDTVALDPSLVNVQVTDAAGNRVTLPRVTDAAACGSGAGWFYDTPGAPTKVVLCPTSCEEAQSRSGASAPKVEVLFGCRSIVR